MNNKFPTIGTILLERGFLNESAIDEICKKQKINNQRFGETAIQMGLISEKELNDVLSFQFEYKLADKKDVNEDLYAAYTADSDELEKLRALRAQILLRVDGLKNTSILCLSTLNEKAIDQLVANLAVVFSQAKFNVLLVDTNIKHPRLHTILNVSNKIGFLDVLANRANSSSICPVYAVPNLSTLTAGTYVPNAQELISSKDKFFAFNEEYKDKFDLVIYYRSDALSTSSTKMLASVVDKIILFESYNKSEVKKVTQLQSDCDVAHAEVIGIVIGGN